MKQSLNLATLIKVLNPHGMDGVFATIPVQFKSVQVGMGSLFTKRERSAMMTALYRIESSQDWYDRYNLDCIHTWRLPPLDICPACGGEDYRSVGFSYPGVDLSASPLEKRFRSFAATTAEEYHALQHEVRPLLPAGAPLKPLTAFGPSTGKFSGQLDHFLWGPWLMLIIQQSVVQALQQWPLRLPPAFPAKIRIAAKAPVPTLVEWQLDYYALQAPSTLAPEANTQCSVCGMFNSAYRVPDTLAVRSSRRL